MHSQDTNELAADFFSVTEAWRQSHAGAHVGVLALRDFANPAQSEELERRKRELEDELRRRYAGMDRVGLRADAVLARLR